MEESWAMIGKGELVNLKVAFRDYKSTTTTGIREKNKTAVATAAGRKHLRLSTFRLGEEWGRAEDKQARFKVGTGRIRRRAKRKKRNNQFISYSENILPKLDRMCGGQNGHKLSVV